MTRSLLVICIMVLNLVSFAQRKIPPITFLENSLEFADGNKSFDEYGQLTDTLRDEQIIKALVKILSDNPKLQIELAGHCAGNEDTLYAQQRADHVRNLLMDGGVDSSRIQAVGKGFREPLITNKVLLGLSSRVERDAANQRNRRVEVKVVGIKPD